MKYIWWIGDESSSVGAYPTKEDAKKAITQGLKSGLLSEKKSWKPIRHEVSKCSTCGRDAERDIIESLGECLSCDHVRSDF